MTVLCGASGCGKSTLLKLLRGSVAASEGQVLLGGTDVSQIDTKNLSLLMAYLSQKISLLSMSILQNAELLSPNSSAEDLEQSLRLARVLDEIEALEQEIRVFTEDVSDGPIQRLGRMISASSRGGPSSWNTVKDWTARLGSRVISQGVSNRG